MNKLLKVISYIFIIIMAIVTLFPFFYMISSALMTFQEVTAIPPKLIPASPQLENFKEAMKVAPFGRYFLNTVFVTVINTLGTLITTTLAAFAINFLNFKHKNWIENILLSLLMIPFEIIVFTNFRTIAKLSLLDSYWALILPFLASVFYIIYLRQFLRSIPMDYYNAAKVDGASDFEFIRRVMIPLSKSTLFTIGLLNFIAGWKLVKQFEEENPNIKVNLQNQGNYGDLNQILVATMQSPQDLPTITQAYPDWMLQFQSADLVADLTDMVKGENGIEDYEDILPGVREEIEIDGKIMGLPFNKSTEVFWYNKTLFDELGLEVPTTFEELEEVSKKIKEEKDIPGVGFDSLPNYYATYMHNNGLEMDQDLDLAGDKSVEAVDYYQKGIKEGYFRIAGTDQYMSGPFANEQVGAYIGSNAGEVYVKDGVEGKFEYAAAPYPAESSVQQGTNIYMFENASDEQKKAAFEFLKFLVSKESQIQFALDTGYMPARTSAVEDSKYKDSDSAIAKILADATKNLYSRPLAPGSQQAYNDIGSTLEQILSNPDADIKAELEAFAPQYQSDFSDAN